MREETSLDSQTLSSATVGKRFGRGVGRLAIVVAIAFPLLSSASCKPVADMAGVVTLEGSVKGDFGIDNRGSGGLLILHQPRDFAGIPFDDSVEVNLVPRTQLVDEQGHSYSWDELHIGESAELRPAFLDKATRVEVTARQGETGLTATRIEWLAPSSPVEALASSASWLRETRPGEFEVEVVVVGSNGGGTDSAASLDKQGASSRSSSVPGLRLQMATPRAREGGGIVSHVVMAQVSPSVLAESALADGKYDPGDPLVALDQKLLRVDIRVEESVVRIVRMRVLGTCNSALWPRTSM